MVVSLCRSPFDLATVVHRDGRGAAGRTGIPARLRGCGAAEEGWERGEREEGREGGERGEGRGDLDAKKVEILGNELGLQCL